MGIVYRVVTELRVNGERVWKVVVSWRMEFGHDIREGRCSPVSFVRKTDDEMDGDLWSKW